MSYEPEVNDYVVWDRGKYGKDEGWVYFKGDPEVERKGFNTCPRYITIETGVKPKPNDDYTKNDKHQYIHTLLLCGHNFWGQLKYIKSRKSACPHHYSECED